MELISVREWHSIYAAARNLVRSAGIDDDLRAAISYDPPTLFSEWGVRRGDARPALAPHIDHTLLRAGATADDVAVLCDEANAHGFAAVCVNPVFIAQCTAAVRAFRVASVANFPLGAGAYATTCAEIARAVTDGAHEVDVVQPLHLVKQADFAQLLSVLRSYRAAAVGVHLKVILETALLTDAEKVASAWLACEVGTDFVKTSTGFGPGGATPRDVTLLRLAAGPTVGVKASGGIRDAASAHAMLAAGADRLGTSASVAICGGAV